MDCRAFHSEGMTQEKCDGTMKEFCNLGVEVPCTIESYEVGVNNNPHVKFVARIGCVRNLNVLQEFQRVGCMEEETTFGLLLFNIFKIFKTVEHQQR